MTLVKKNHNNTEVYHFIGKDRYFHALFWPAMRLKAQDLEPHMPSTRMRFDRQWREMSKSRGTFIKAMPVFKTLDPEHLRYYFASKLSASVEDINLGSWPIPKVIQTWWVKSSIRQAAQDLSIKIMVANWHWQSASLLWCNKSLMPAKTSLPLWSARFSKPCVWFLMACADKANDTSMTKTVALNKVEGQQPKYKRCVLSR